MEKRFIPARADRRPARLSFAQERLWFLNQLEPESSAYNRVLALRLDGALDLHALRKALDAIVERHEILRTTYIVEDCGDPVQRIGRSQIVELPILDLTDCRQIQRDEHVQRVIADLVERPFDLGRDLMLRAWLLRLSPDQQVLVVVVHHIASDGWSSGIFCRELAAFYTAFSQGKSPVLPKLPVQYADYAVWQREYLSEAVLAKQLGYWKKQLRDLPTLQLPADRPRPALQGCRGAQQTFKFSEELTGALKKITRQEGVTLYMTLLAAFQTLLSRYSGQDDICVGSPIANRRLVEIEGLIGFFVNTLVLRSDLSGNPTFREVLTRVKRTALESYGYQDLPFEKLVEELQPERNLGMSPLFQVMFALQNFPKNTFAVPELAVSPIQVHLNTAKFDLSLALTETTHGLEGEIEYSTDLFDSATIDRMIAHFHNLLEGIVADPGRRISELPLLSEVEKHQLLVEWNRTNRDYPNDKCIHELFEEQVERTPEAVAVVFGDQHLTYREVNAKANQLAHYIKPLGVGSDVLVGLCTARSLELVIGLLGILKAGGAYLPLDPYYPQERLGFMLQDAGAGLVLTDRVSLNSWRPSNAKTICLDRDWEEIAKEPQTNPTRQNTPNSLAYLIYTSGSTGQPKGVAIEHRNTVAFLSWVKFAFTQEELSVVLASTSICFDLSIFEMFAPLTCGGTVVIAENALALSTIPNNCNVSLLNTVPSAINELLRLGAIPASVRVVNLAGEPLRPDLVRRVYESTSVRKVYDLYGPSECTTYSTWTCRTADGPQIIGRPIANTQVYLLDDHRDPVPIGVVGEIYIGGDGVARGYLNRPQLTAERFIIHSFDGGPARRLYKTGDLGRYLPDGNIELLGRIDNQVKLRGYRIELGEIEAVLNQHPSIREAIGIVQEDRPGEKQLVIYLVSTDQPGLKTNELRNYLTARLPHYMMPSAIVMLANLPLTLNGKIDRKALAAPEARRSKLDETYVAPRTATEKTITNIWTEVLGFDQIGNQDNFFTLGGHSLKAIQVIARLRDILKKEVGLNDIFSNPTIAELANILDQRTAEADEESTNLIQAIGRDGPLPLSFSQERAWFIQQLYPSVLAYNSQCLLYFTGHLDINALERSLTEIVRRHEIFRTTFSEANGHPVQRIHASFEVSLPLVNIQALPDQEREAALQQRIAEESRRPFDLSTFPLVRWSLVQLKSDEFVLIHVENHLVHDGWSFSVFRRELLEVYRAFSLGAASPLAEPALQFADYAYWQRQWMKGEQAKRQLDYWKRQLEGCQSILALATDHARPPKPSFRGAALRFEIPADLGESLIAFSRKRGVTLFVTMYTAFLALMYRYTGQEDICIGTGVANRGRKEAEALIGMLVNNVALRTNLNGNPRFVDLLTQVRDVTLEAFTNEDVPFDHVVRALELGGDDSRNPIFQVMFNFHDAPLPEVVLSDVTLCCIEAISNGSAKFDMNLILIPRREDPSRREPAGGMTLIWEYSTDLFEASTIDRMACHYLRLLQEVTVKPVLRLSELPMTTEPEREVLVRSFNDTKRDYPSERCIHELFEDQVERTPEAVAVVFEDQQLTYRELNSRANQLAHYLQKLGIGPKSLVGICMERSVDLVVGLLGILKAGGAYLPLDLSYPKERLGFMLDDTQAGIVLTDRRSFNSLPSRLVRLICLDWDWEEIAKEPRVNLRAQGTADSLAYVVYTSGSTGVPKGVEVRHRGVARLLFGVDYVQLDEAQKFLHLAPISFDAATFELWGALLHGGKCVLFPGEVPSPRGLGEVLKKHHVNTLWLTSALFNTVIDEEPGALSEINQLVIGGEALSVPHVRKGLAVLPNTEIINGYGPTESTTFTCCYSIPRQLEDNLSSIPIGRPISNTQVYILDPTRTPVPIGVPGELHIGGDGLARGYLNRPELTREKFIPNRFSADPASRLYRTGDRARYLPDGNIEFLGRIDDQVKIRGFRVELGEIEHALSNHPGIREAVVMVREDSFPGRQLVGYVVVKPLGILTASEVRRYLKEILPEYMVPTAFVFLEKFPLTANGKIERRALAAPPTHRSVLDEKLRVPRTPLEQQIAQIWAELLRLDKVGIDDNFFEIGGHSLLATQVVSRLIKTFQIELPLRTLFESPTVAGLAERIKQTCQTESAALALRSMPRARDLPLSFAQQRLWFLDQLEPNSSVYNIPRGLRLKGKLDIGALEQSLNEIVRRHETLRTTFTRSVDGQPVQRIAPSLNLPLSIVDLSHLSEREAKDEIRRLSNEEAHRPFDLERGQVVRTVLLRLGSEDHILLLTLHHIASDGWSITILDKELTTLYQAFSHGQPSPLNALPIQYVDFALWQRKFLQGDVLDAQLAYWKKQLDNIQPMQLPADRRRPAVQRYRGAGQSFVLSKDHAEELKSLSRQQGTTLFMTLLAAFQALLYRYTGQEDIALGCPMAGRNHAEIEGLIGFFVNTLVLRTHISGTLTFTELLARVRTICLDAYSHQDLPFEKLVEELQPDRNANCNPLFQVTFQLNNDPRTSLKLPAIEVEDMELESRIAKFDLSLSVSDCGEDITGRLQYNTDLFDNETAARLVVHFQALLKGIVAHPEQRISDLPLLGVAEKHQLLMEWNETEKEYPNDKCIQQLFEEQVERAPDATAIVFERQQLSYRELNNRSNQLARYLQKLGVGPEALVGIGLERSLEMPVALLGVLKAGGAYVPLDPSYPEERLAFMVDDAKVGVLLTQQGVLGKFPHSDVHAVCLDSAWEEISKENPESPGANATTENLAYVIYTSGSTGRPKGVAVEHRQLINYVASITDRLDLASQRSFATVSTLAADLGNTVIFPCLCLGATLHVISQDRIADAEAMAEYFDHHVIDCLKIVPSHLAALQSVAHPERLMPRQLLILGGEASDVEWVERLAQLAPNCRIVNHYGPTETTVGVTTYEIQKNSAPVGFRQLPLGRPLGNTKVYLLDANLSPVPIGVSGELYIGGLNLARGYISCSELTAEKFIANPFSDELGARLYKTGDLARYLADGNIEFLGRIDNQIKLRGYRIEPGEIEGALKAHSEVQEAVVLEGAGADGGKHLAAYVVVSPDCTPTVAGRSRYRLPNGMAVAQLNRNETDYIYQEIFERQAYLRHGITIKDGDCIFDVGANIGLFTLFANQIARRPRVHSFEPNPAVYAILKANARLYGFDGKLFNCGLSDEAKRATFTFFPGFSLLSGFYADPQADQEVVKTFIVNQRKAGSSEMTELVEQADAILEGRFKPETFDAALRTVSSIIEQERIECIDLLKINVEKSELDVLLGIKETDWRKIQQIVLEVDVENNLSPITSLLEKHGYEYVVEQDYFLQGTSLRYVYAIRPSTERKLTRQQRNGAHIKPLPLVDTPLMSEREIRAFLTAKLPEYMIPSEFIFVDALPLTPNGKLNRLELLALRQGHKNQETKFAAPCTPAEELLTNIWAQVLGLEKIGTHDNFFELGGHSLLAIKIVSRIRSSFSVPFSLREFFEMPTVYALAQRLKNLGQQRQSNQNDQITRVVRDQFRIDRA